MLDIERELLADTFTTFDLVYSGTQPLFSKLFIDTKIPWLMENKTGKKKSMVQQMAELYDRHKGNKEK